MISSLAQITDNMATCFTEGPTPRRDVESGYLAIVPHKYLFP